MSHAIHITANRITTFPLIGTLIGTEMPSHSSFNSSTSGAKKEFIDLGSFGPGIMDTRIIFSILYRSSLGRFKITI